MDTQLQKLTKIIATIGPASESEANLKAMVTAGMNIARFNTKHSDPAWHNERIQRVHRVAEEMGVAVGVLLDLQGPEIRALTPGQGEFPVAQDEEVTITDNEQAAGKAIIVPTQVVSSLKVGNEILLEDGACEFVITQAQNNTLTAKAKFACTVKYRKTMNTPGIVLDMPSLTERDMTYLEGVDLTKVDYVGLSFVRDVEDLNVLKTELTKRKSAAKIIAKIENQKALENLESIVANSDAIMVARGDLGVEVPFQQLIFWQKEMILQCRETGIPVITATEMLKSMVTKPRPTRAEVSDVAHAIYDGTDAIMLSDETTVGQYPVKVVETQATIAAYNEPYTSPLEIDWSVTTPQQAICFSAFELLNQSMMTIDKVICVSPTGEAARFLASYHPEHLCHVLTNSKVAYRQMALLYGVKPHFFENIETTSEGNLALAKKSGIVESGETVLYIYSSESSSELTKNTLSVVTVR